MKCRIFAAVFVVAAGVASVAAQSITATKAYVDRKYADATNAVPSIVTNEVSEFTAWTASCDDPVIQAALDELPSLFIYYGGEYNWYFEGAPRPNAFGYEVHAMMPAGGLPDATVLVFHSVYLNPAGEYVKVTATRERFTRNALGLARLKDLEPLPTYEAVTNTARDVVNTVWDAKLGVAWEARMHDGHLYYIAVTNAPGGAE